MMRITPRGRALHRPRAPGAALRGSRSASRKDGRITALDLFVVGDNGPYEQQGDCRHRPATSSRCCISRRRCGGAASSVLTNTPPRGAQRAAGRHAGHRAHRAGPRQGGAQARASIRSRSVGSTRRPARRRSVRRTPRGQRQLRRPARSSRKRSTRAPSCSTGTSARRAAASGSGTKVRGVGVAVSTFVAGSIGFDGLFVIKPDGRVHDPVGHRQSRHRLGDRRAIASRPRCSACRGRRCEVVWGNTSKNLPWTCMSGGSQTTHAMTRAAHAAATDAKKKLQEIAAKTLGGTPEQLSGRRTSASPAAAAA